MCPQRVNFSEMGKKTYSNIIFAGQIPI